MQQPDGPVEFISLVHLCTYIRSSIVINVLGTGTALIAGSRQHSYELPVFSEADRGQIHVTHQEGSSRAAALALVRYICHNQFWQLQWICTTVYCSVKYIFYSAEQQYQQYVQITLRYHRNAVWLSVQGAVQHSASTHEHINQKILNKMQEDSI